MTNARNLGLPPIGNKPTQRNRPSDLVQSGMDSFFRPPSRPLLQVPQVHRSHPQFPDVHAEVSLDSEAGELLYVPFTHSSAILSGPKIS